MTGKHDPVLRAKYLDWCSARIAERFLGMSPDEIYERAERATSGIGQQAGTEAAHSSFSSPYDTPDWHAAIEQVATAVAEPASADTTSFRALVARLTEVLADEMELPTFEEWSAAYSEAPEEFDSDMLGFWKNEL